MPQFSKDRSTIYAVKEVIIVIRLIREASVVIKDIMDALLSLRLMGDPNGFCGMRQEGHISPTRRR
jgi:hypothetical protein